MIGAVAYNWRYYTSSSKTAVYHKISAAISNLSAQIATLAKNIKTNKEGNDRDGSGYQKISFRWTQAGTIVAGILSFLTLCVLYQTLGIMDKQREIYSNQLAVMRLDQRAWINLSVSIQQSAENKPLTAILRIVNTGKTPAKAVEQHYVLEKVMAKNRPSLNYNKQHVIHILGILVPNSPIDVVVRMLSNEKPSILDPPNLTKEDINQLNSGEAYLVFFARVTYRDIHNTSHWVNYCFWVGAPEKTFTARTCANYNDVDND